MSIRSSLVRGKAMDTASFNVLFFLLDSVKGLKVVVHLLCVWARDGGYFCSSDIMTVFFIFLCSDLCTWWDGCDLHLRTQSPVFLMGMGTVQQQQHKSNKLQDRAQLQSKYQDYSAISFVSYLGKAPDKSKATQSTEQSMLETLGLWC